MGDGESRYRLKVHRGAAGLRDIAGDWRKLTDAATRTETFQLVEWHQCALAELESDPESVYYCVLRRDGEPVAIFPLKRQVRGRFGISKRVLRLPYLGTARGDIVCRETPEAQSYLTHLLDGLKAHAELQWDELVFSGVMGTGHAHRVLGEGEFPRCVRQRDGCCNCLPARPEAERLQRYSSSFRERLRRARRALDKLGESSFEIVSEWPALERAYEEFLELEASGWKSHTEKGEALEKDKRWRDFYHELLRSFATLGRAEIIFLRQGGRAIGGAICLRGGGTAHLVKTAYDEARARAAPGNLTLERLLDRCAQDGGVEYVNIILDDEWHEKFKPTPTPVYHYHLYNTTPIGLLSFGIRRLKQKRRASSSKAERTATATDPAPEN